MFPEVGEVQIHHVTGGVVVLGDVFLQVGVEAHVVKGVAGGEVGGGEVVDAVGNVDFEEGVGAHGFGEGFGDIDELVFGIPVPFADATEDVVGAVVFELEVVADVVVEGGSERAEDGVGAGVAFGHGAEGILGKAGVAGVEAADDSAFGAEEFGIEAGEGDAEVGGVDEGLAEAGEAGHLFDDFGALGGRERAAEEEGLVVVACGEGFGFFENVFDGFLLQVSGEFFVIPGGGGVAGEVEGVGEVVAFAAPDGLEVEDGGDEHDAVEIDAVGVEEFAAEGGGAGGAVAFPDEEFGGGPAGVFGDVEADEFGDGAGVFLEAVEVFVVLGFGGAAVTCADGVDEDEIGFVQEAGLVVDELVRGREGEAVVLEFDAFGAEETEVEPDGGGAGAAVEGEGERAFGSEGGIGFFFGVGDVEDFGGGFAFGVFESDGACGGGVVDFLAVDGDAVFSGDGGSGLGFVVGRFVFGFFGGFFLGAVRGVFGFLGAEGEGEDPREESEEADSEHGVMVGEKGLA